MFDGPGTLFLTTNVIFVLYVGGMECPHMLIAMRKMRNPEDFVVTYIMFDGPGVSATRLLYLPKEAFSLA
jgi:hypothetical protein